MSTLVDFVRSSMLYQSSKTLVYENIKQWLRQYYSTLHYATNCSYRKRIAVNVKNTESRFAIYSALLNPPLQSEK